MTTDEAVAAIADAMADAESKAHTIRAKLTGLKDEFEAVNQNGDAGYLATKKFYTRGVAIAALFEASLFELHADMTEYAQAKNIDLPSVEGGGGR